MDFKSLLVLTAALIFTGYSVAQACDEKKPVEKLRAAVKSARSILVLGDNAGETVFDKLLIENMGGADVFYAVRGSPVINDATLADAQAVGPRRRLVDSWPGALVHFIGTCGSLQSSV